MKKINEINLLKSKLFHRIVKRIAIFCVIVAGYREKSQQMSPNNV